jgi:hypothetical protein
MEVIELCSRYGLLSPGILRGRVGATGTFVLSGINGHNRRFSFLTNSRKDKEIPLDRGLRATFSSI